MRTEAVRATKRTATQEPASRWIDERTQRTFFASGSVAGALAMSSCCIVPLVLFSLGITGAWIGNLASLYPYKPYFFVATALFLGLGFYRVYRKPGAGACDADRQCGASPLMRITKFALWLSTFLVAVALAFPYYAPLLLGA